MEGQKPFHEIAVELSEGKFNKELAEFGIGEFGIGDKTDEDGYKNIALLAFLISKSHIPEDARSRIATSLIETLKQTTNSAIIPICAKAIVNMGGDIEDAIKYLEYDLIKIEKIIGEVKKYSGIAID
ncbi:hypothetical protein KAU19_02810 [Candidatus Parcubacteria bacterium]|nr:hypothetical protein [Candidatus Parcubacteria bacterium]